MRIQDISPVFYTLHSFKYQHREQTYKKLSLWKSQYVYRFLYVEKGALKVRLGDRTESMREGDLLYLVPGEPYLLLPDGRDFSLYNIGFDLLPQRAPAPKRPTLCVFLSDYAPSLCLPPLVFADGECLNHNRVFHGIPCKQVLESLFRTGSKDPCYDFFARTAISFVLRELLIQSQGVSRKKNPADAILSYIRLNPEKDLSGQALSRRFAYHGNYINKLVKDATGKSLGEYTRHVKIEYAKALLSEGELSLGEVAAELGYYDYSHFYKAFVAETGASPSQGRSNG